MNASDGTTNSSSGALVSFEGIDGSGKSTQARALAQRLQDCGHEVVLTREPGGAEGAEAIRRLLVEGDPDRWSAETEILLFNAARRDHLEKTILPALASGKIVITDRFADSTRIYQGAARASLRPLVDKLHALVIGIEPDLTFLIDMDPQAALARGLARHSGEDRFEELGVGFQERLRAGFLDLARDHPGRIRVVDGARPMEEISTDVAGEMQNWLKARVQ
ncbi:MAG: dTMP kinase [Roseinatronobacter sp.]